MDALNSVLKFISEWIMPALGWLISTIYNAAAWIIQTLLDVVIVPALKFFVDLYSKVFIEHPVLNTMLVLLTIGIYYLVSFIQRRRERTCSLKPFVFVVLLLPFFVDISAMGLSFHADQQEPEISAVEGGERVSTQGANIAAGVNYPAAGEPVAEGTNESSAGWMANARATYQSFLAVSRCHPSLLCSAHDSIRYLPLISAALQHAPVSLRLDPDNGGQMVQTGALPAPSLPGALLMQPLLLDAAVLTSGQLLPIAQHEVLLASGVLMFSKKYH